MIEPFNYNLRAAAPNLFRRGWRMFEENTLTTASPYRNDPKLQEIFIAFTLKHGFKAPEQEQYLRLRGDYAHSSLRGLPVSTEYTLFQRVHNIASELAKDHRMEELPFMVIAAITTKNELSGGKKAPPFHKPTAYEQEQNRAHEIWLAVAVAYLVWLYENTPANPGYPPQVKTP